MQVDRYTGANSNELEEIIKNLMAKE